MTRKKFLSMGVALATGGILGAKVLSAIEPQEANIENLMVTNNVFEDDVSLKKLALTMEQARDGMINRDEAQLIISNNIFRKKLTV